MEPIRCIVVDDEELARGLLANYISRMEQLQLMGSYQNPLEALAVLEDEQIDLVFLDIQMPELKGTEFAARINSQQTRIIFTTAYSEYALESYDLHALDYLVKPITFERFTIAIQKLQTGQVASKSNQKYLTLKSGYDLHKIAVDAISHIVSDGDYVVYHHCDGTLMCHERLSHLEATLPGQFMRIHRSYIVNTDKVTQLRGRNLKLGDQVVPISESYYQKVKDRLF